MPRTRKRAKRPITASEMGKRGGRARAKALTAKRRREIARLGGLAAKRRRSKSDKAA